MTEHSFVSRGGTKLQHALEQFNVSAAEKVVLDVGSSTGGFVDCLLRNGAKKVYSLDTAYGELAWKLRNDPRVVVMERTNVLFMKDLPEEVDLITIDVTFTSLLKILPIVKKYLKPAGKIIALLKPQYEDQPLALRHKGIIPEGEIDNVITRVTENIKELGFSVEGKTESPIKGGRGNTEYLLYLSYDSNESH